MAGGFVAVLAALMVGLAAACTGDSSKPQPTTTGNAAGAPRSVAIYLVRDGKVAPVRRTPRPDAPDPIRAALQQLYYAEPTEAERAAGYGTAISCPRSAPAGFAGCGGLELGAGVARVASAGPLSPLAQAQVVYTLTRFPDVERVVFVADGTAGRPLARADFEKQTPQILVESPLPGDTVRSPIHLRGTANVFEANVSLDIRGANGKLLKQTYTTATSGTGTRGTFDTELALPDREGAVTVVAYESSAKDGSYLHVVEVPLELSR